MAIRPIQSALSFAAVLAVAVAADAQIAGYPNGGGRLPGTMSMGPQFPTGPVSPAAYNGQPTYINPPTNAYTPAPGTDRLTGAPAVSYGTPQPAPQNVGPIASGKPTPAPVAANPVTSGPIASGANSTGPSLFGQQTVVQQTPTLAPPMTQPLPSPAQPLASQVQPLPPIVTPLPAGVGGSAAPTTYGGTYNIANNYAPPTPDYSTPPAIPQYAPNITPMPTEMPVGNLNRQEITPFARGSSPPSYSAWLPRSWRPQSAPIYDNTPANANYGAFDPNAPQPSYGQEPVYGQGYPAGTPGSCGPFYPGQNCGPGVPCPCAPAEPWYTNFALISTLDAFKTPVDLDGLNANFGKRVGGIASFPIFRDLGLGGQVSSTAAWYDWRGTQFTGDRMRFQNFNSVGLFARSCTTGLGFGIAHDWLYDDYYADFHLSQFRVAGSWEINCNNEVGIWAALPQRRDSTFIGAPAVNNQFQSLTQGNLYWKHYWSDIAWTSTYAGLAESPSDISYGANVQVAVNRFVAVTGAFTYVWPGSGGNNGRQEEIWNLSFGFLFYPGTAMAAQRSQFRPMFAPADNGNFATWRK